jgi:hypothetical protein
MCVSRELLERLNGFAAHPPHFYLSCVFSCPIIWILFFCFLKPEGKAETSRAALLAPLINASNTSRSVERLTLTKSWSGPSRCKPSRPESAAIGRQGP